MFPYAMASTILTFIWFNQISESIDLILMLHKDVGG